MRNQKTNQSTNQSTNQTTKRRPGRRKPVWNEEHPTMTLAEAAQNMADAIADLMNHPDCPVDVYNDFLNVVINLEFYDNKSDVEDIRFNFARHVMAVRAEQDGEVLSPAGAADVVRLAVERHAGTGPARI